MEAPSAESLHRIRGRIDVALDLIGRCVIAWQPDGTEGTDHILTSLVLARRDLAAAADAVEEQLARRMPIGA